MSASVVANLASENIQELDNAETSIIAADPEDRRGVLVDGEFQIQISSTEIVARSEKIGVFVKITGDFAIPSELTNSIDNFYTVTGLVSQFSDSYILDGQDINRFEINFNNPIAFEDLRDAFVWNDFLNGDDLIIGGGLNDLLYGYDGNDQLVSNGGQDKIYGGDGIDTLSLDSDLPSWALEVTDSAWDTLNESSDLSGYYLSNIGSQQNEFSNVKLQLVEVERIQFSDTNLALDLDASAGQTAKILGAVFGKEAVSNKQYAGIGLHFLDSGVSYEALMDLALNAALGDNANDHASVVKLLYKNVLNVDATDSDAEPFIQLLEDGMTKGALGVMAAETSYNTDNIGLVGLQETGLAYEIFEG